MNARETFAELARGSAFSALVEEVEAVISPKLAPYVDELGEEFEATAAKSIKDAVWGMIDITAAEVVVIDSPPFQRLRGIRQLGVGFLTYPTAGYSRFEHSLGALHQAERMLLAVATRSRFEQEVLEARSTVRLAALLHDIGHMPLSHISERYYAEQESTHEELIELASDITGEVAETLLITEPGLAECLSAATIATPGFSSLLRRQAGYSREIIAGAALAILGKTPTVRQLFISQLISNVIDADKLDYMFRDAFVTRVPLAVDLERLLFKLTCVDVPATQLWGSLARSAEPQERALVLGTDVTGQQITYDLAAARKVLFERIYFHHKTRAAERVALRILDRLALRPAELLAFDDDLFARYGGERFAEQIGPLVTRLVNRRLPRRVFAAADDFIDRRLMARQAEVEQRGVLESTRLRHAIANAAMRADLEAAMLDEIRRLAEMTQATPADDVWIDVPPDPIGTGDARLPEVAPDGTVHIASAYPPGAAAATQNPLPTTFVFVTGKDVDLALCHVAVQRVLAEKFALYFTTRSADYAKVPSDRVEALKRQLETAEPEIFRGLRGLRPRSRAAHSADLDARIAVQARRFQHFTNDTEVRVDGDRIRTFLDQFPEPLVAPMLTVLERIEFLDRATLGRGFAERLITDAPDGAVFAPLTSEYGKSAGHLPYFLADHPQRPEILELDAALERDAPLVIFDDVLISGVQSGRIVATWFGDGDHPSAPVLTEEHRERLRARNPAFRFAYAWAPGLEALSAELEKYGLGGDVSALRLDEAEKPIDAIGAEADELRKALTEIGYQVLRSTKGARAENPWTEERLRDSALGYNNDERLVVMEYNTPTGTITALWKGGVFDGAQWLPLFPRRQTSG